MEWSRACNKNQQILFISVKLKLNLKNINILRETKMGLHKVG
jgi:hypothetical protein